MALLVLLVFLGVSPGKPWHQATNPRLTITEAMTFMRKLYRVRHAPNTRESVRFSIVNPLVHAGVLIPNPDQPRAKQSPNYCYQVDPNIADWLRLLP